MSRKPLFANLSLVLKNFIKTPKQNCVLLCILTLLGFTHSAFAFASHHHNNAGLNVNTPQVTKHPVDALVFQANDLMPYQYVSSDGTPKGFAIDVLSKVLLAAKANQTVKNVRFVPWARAFKMAQKNPNFVAFMTARTSDTAHLFHWVGPVLAQKSVIFSSEDHSAQARFVDFMDKKIGVVRESPAAQLLVANGLNPNNLVLKSSSTQILQLIAEGRLTYFAHEKLGAQYLLNALHTDHSFVPVFTIQEDLSYFALNIDSDPAAIELFQAAFDDVFNSKAIPALRRKYSF